MGTALLPGSQKVHHVKNLPAWSSQPLEFTHVPCANLIINTVVAIRFGEMFQTNLMEYTHSATLRLSGLVKTPIFFALWQK